jgi:hypothetical protein
MAQLLKAAALKILLLLPLLAHTHGRHVANQRKMPCGTPQLRMCTSVHANTGCNGAALNTGTSWIYCQAQLQLKLALHGHGQHSIHSLL